MKYWSIIILILIPIFTFGQKEVSNWYFYYGGLDFNCNPPNPISPSVDFYPIEGCSSISDSLGKLLFYTDGSTVFDKNHQLMLNGFDIGLDSMCFGSSTQSVLILKQPLQDSLYYIFTTDCAENKLMKGFNYSIVNMNLNNGNGEVVLKKQQLLNKTCEKVAAVQNSNGVDTWVVTHEWGNSNFDAYLLTSSGLISTPVISSTGRVQLPADTTDLYPTIPYPECAARGYLKFSAQGDKIIVLSASDCHPNESHAELFSFNSLLGTVSYDFNIHTTDSNIYYGASFSPDGNILYLSSGWYGSFIHQFDLSSYDSLSVANSKYIVFNDTTFTLGQQPSALQIGPDGKIYNAASTQYLNVISNPNNTGVTCNFQLNAIPLALDSCQLGFSEYGLPNNNESFYLNNFIGTSCSSVTNVNFNTSDSCANAPVYFFDISNFYPFAINNWSWDFGEPSSGSLNYSQLKNPQHTYSSTGTFQVTLIAYSDTFWTCKSDSITKAININCITSVEQINPIQHSINIFPNPASNFVHIESKTPVTGINIFNSQGQLVYEKYEKINIDKINLNLKDGLYIIMLSNKLEKTYRKIIINKNP